MAQTTKNTDASAGIGPFHAVAGMHIGAMGYLPREPAIQSVLTVAAVPGQVPDEVRHKHLPLSYQAMDLDDLHKGVDWVLAQLDAQRTVLVRSEGGCQRPALVVGLAIVALGGHYVDAVVCLRHANNEALTDFRYLALIDEAARQLGQGPYGQGRTC